MITSEIVVELVQFQRRRCIIMKSRIMQKNRLQAVIAGCLGYRAQMEEKERRKYWLQAGTLIENVARGAVHHELENVIAASQIGIDALLKAEDDIEKPMVKLAGSLPVAGWVKEAAQKGFGLPSLAIVVGEAGDLSNYDCPGKLWKRFGCAPWTYNGKTRMGATWKSGREGKLPAAEWESFGYSPRRRSVAYLIGENLVRQNGKASDPMSGTERPNAGPYRFRYEEAKAKTRITHPDWWTCPACKGSGTNARAKTCQDCKGKGELAMHAHLHAKLLAAKLLLRNLWCQWNHKPKRDRAVLV